MLTCEHGGNEIPGPYRKYFQGQSAVLKTHRGFDIGALDVAKAMQKNLKVSLDFCLVSRLLIDTNRFLDSPTLMSEFTRHLDEKEKGDIVRKFYSPHWRKVFQRATKLISENDGVVHVAVHSMTDDLDGQIRSMEIAILYDPKRKAEKRLATLWIREMRKKFPDFKLTRNNPYKGSGEGLTTALRRKFSETAYLGIELEVNQKFIQSLKTFRQRQLFSTAVSTALESALRILHEN